MANIKTRIILRNDSLSNWLTSDLVLNKGEMAIATLSGGELAEVRIGNNGTWANALKLNINADQISGIIDTIKGNTKKYQVVANGEGGNSWKLQEAPLSAANDEWTDVTGSDWTVDFGLLSDYAQLSDLNDVSVALSTDYVGKIEGLSTEVNGRIDDVENTLNTVSSDYLKATDFAALSNEIGLSAASSSNTVVTQNDIKDLAGAMHFRGAVTPNEGETDLEALARVIENPASGDVAIITTTSKEYVYNGSEWIELGDEVLYATKAEVASTVENLSNTISTDYATKSELNDTSVALSTDYVSKIGDLSTATETLVGTVSAETLVSANAYTDEQIAALSIGDYATIEYVNEVSGALSTDYVGKIGDLSTATETLVGTVSAETLVSANAYTDEQIAALSIDDYIKHGEVVDSDLSGFFILDCGASTLREGEPAVS